MKKAGLLGGMSWESTVTYYQIINRIVGQQLGGNHSADMVIRSLDLELIDSHQRRGEWEQVAELLCRGAKELECLGADFILMASNTVHRVYDAVQGAVSVPILHIADPTVEAVQRAGIQTVGLLGTRYTMEGDFLKEKLTAAGIDVIVPPADEIEKIHHAIFTEGCVGNIKEETRTMFLHVMCGLKQRGAQGIILGCTELGLMVSAEGSCLPLFDTAVLHAETAAEEILRRDGRMEWTDSN